jgi:hypothetical protein
MESVNESTHGAIRDSSLIRWFEKSSFCSKYEDLNPESDVHKEQCFVMETFKSFCKNYAAALSA